MIKKANEVCGVQHVKKKVSNLAHVIQDSDDAAVSAPGSSRMNVLD